MNAPTLRPYQTAATTDVLKAFGGGLNRLLVKKPTGTGKTVWFATLLKALEPWLAQFKPTERRMLVIAHREELLDQALEKIQRANPGLTCCVEQGDRHANLYADVVIASIQTLSAVKFRRLKHLLSRMTFRLVIVDEAHHSAAATYRTALAHLGFLPVADMTDTNEIEAATHDDVLEMEKALKGWDLVAPKDRLLIGVTATPNRTDAIGLGCVFQTIAYSYDLKLAIDDGWLVPLEPWAIETNESLDDVHTSHGDLNQRELAIAVNKAKRNLLAVEGWKRYAAGLPTIAFTVDVQHAHDLAAIFTAAGVRAFPLSGETPKEERRELLKRFRAGQVDVITNCMVLTEGTDLPITECILHAKPTTSATLYEQMTGRGLRLFPPNKRRCVVIDVVDVTRRHTLQAAPILYGLPPGLNAKGVDLAKLAAELDALKMQHPALDIEELLATGRLSLEDLRLRAEAIDVWAVPSLGAFGAGRALTWIKTGVDCYRLQYPWADGKEILQVSKDLLGHWEVSLTLYPSTADPFNRPAPRQRTIASLIDTSDKAAGVAETFVLTERRSVMKMKDREAPWRSRPASPKQLQTLKNMRVPLQDKKITMGQASDLLDIAMARKGRR